MRRVVNGLLMLAALSLPLVALSGCHKQPPAVQPPPPPPPAPAAQTPPPPPPPPPAPTPAPAPAPPTEEELFARMTLEELTAQHPLEDVFFLYDQSELSAEARASLEKNAAYLRKWSSIRIRVEGHADSRGTNEYNLALGERRANAARDYLGSLGIDLARVAMVSKGEEQPFCMEDTDTCYGLNRRAHMIFTAK